MYFDKGPTNFSNDRNNSTFYNYNKGDKGNDEVVSIGAWVGIIIVMAIPIVNIITLLIMAFASQNNNIKNFSKAFLITMGISLILAILLKGCS